MEPIGLDYKNSKGYIAIHKCKSCGAVRRNKLALGFLSQPGHNLLSTWVIIIAVEMEDSVPV